MLSFTGNGKQNINENLHILQHHKKLLTRNLLENKMYEEININLEKFENLNENMLRKEGKKGLSPSFTQDKFVLYWKVDLTETYSSVTKQVWVTP